MTGVIKRCKPLGVVETLCYLGAGLLLKCHDSYSVTHEIISSSWMSHRRPGIGFLSAGVLTT